MAVVVYSDAEAYFKSGKEVHCAFSEVWSVAWPEALCVVMWMVDGANGEGCVLMPLVVIFSTTIWDFLCFDT